MDIKESRAYKYCKWCVRKSNKKVPQYVKKQAKAWIKIAEGKNKEAYISEKAFELMCRLLKLMKHPDLGCSIYEGMEDYAWFMAAAIFCTKYRKDKSRYYTTVLLEIARKNFKTFNSAIIFIIGMIIEPKFSRFFSVAPDYKLSSELRLAVRKIIKSSPDLEDYFKIKRDEIVCNLNDITYTPLAYSNDKMDGKLANIFLADEAGALDTYPVEAMRSSQITIKNKLGIIISTQYPNDNNVMIDEIDYAKKVLDGLTEDRRYFSLLYEPDEEIQKEWETNELCIYQSNPVAVENKMIFDDLVKKRAMAVMYENRRENYLCKHNNILYRGIGTEGYVDIDSLKKCRGAISPDFWRGKKVYMGLDLSLTDDNTSVSWVCEEEGKIYYGGMCFIPEDRIDFKSKKEKLDYRMRIKAGECVACGDNVIDYGAVERFIMSLEERYGCEIMQIGYDRWNALSTVQKLENNGYECVEIKQHSSVLHSPTKLLKEKILEEKFVYDGNRMLEINFENARCTEDTNLNKYVNKKKSAGKVDMVVSLINAMYLLEQEQLNGWEFVSMS